MSTNKTNYWGTSYLPVGGEAKVLHAHAALTRFASSKKFEDLDVLVTALCALSEFALEKERHCISISETCKALNTKCANLEVQVSVLRDEVESANAELKKHEEELEAAREEALGNKASDDDVPF